MNKDNIIRKFKEIKDSGFVRSNRRNNTGIGKTFEDLLGVEENNFKEADFEGFEVKSQRSLTVSYLTLFTKSPSGPKGANTILRDSFGEFYEEYPNLKKLHTSIFSNRFNTYKNSFGFKVQNDYENRTLNLIVKDLTTDQIISNTVFWSHAVLQEILITKLQALFYVTAETRIINDEEHFHYTKALIYHKPDINKFLSLIDQGKIMIDIRIGSYKSGKNIGKTHDHGTGFRLSPRHLAELYEENFIVE